MSIQVLDFVARLLKGRPKGLQRQSRAFNMRAMFGMNQKMMESLIKSQFKKLKKVEVEIESQGKKKLCQISDQDIQQNRVTLELREKSSGESLTLRFRL